MDLKDYVKQNQTVIQFVKDVTLGTVDKYVGTLDYATARFNTILLRLSEDPLKADQLMQDVHECFQIIQNFYKYTLRLNKWHWTFSPMLKLILHVKGVKDIPKIKFLLEKITN